MRLLILASSMAVIALTIYWSCGPKKSELLGNSVIFPAEGIETASFDGKTILPAKSHWPPGIKVTYWGVVEEEIGGGELRIVVQGADVSATSNAQALLEVVRKEAQSIIGQRLIISRENII